MAEKLCDICKKSVATIRITGEGDYCLDCHNERMLKRYGRENDYKYSKRMSVLEPSGAVHAFEIEHVILGSIVSWDAYEKNGNYHFREISDIDDNATVVAARFFQKIVDGVCTKTLQEYDMPASNLAYDDGRCYGLKDKGTINVIEDEGRDYEIGFEIDGKVFTPEQIAELLGSYPGFSIQYQIHDASDPVLKEDEYLMPVRITKQSLVDELETAIAIQGDRGFISYKDTRAFDEAFYLIIKKLKVLADSGKREDALAAARQMARVMMALETDDDFFPEYNMECICKAADPHGLDEELAEIMREFRERFL